VITDDVACHPPLLFEEENREISCGGITSTVKPLMDAMD
jgi:hypothetical protein